MEILPMLTLSQARRPRALALLALLSVLGCGQSGQSAPPATQITPPETVNSPAAAASNQPAAANPGPQHAPPPAPATFDVAALSEQVTPVVVNITTTHQVTGLRGEGSDPFDFFFGPRGRRGDSPKKQTALGTGFIIDPAGYVVTNEHVVREADEVRVRLADEREFRADVVGRDPKVDLALLKLDGASNLPIAKLGSSEQLRVGEHVLAVGNPFGLGHTVTLGIVSAKARSIGAGPYDDFIQTDASINPGNSGGPLFNWRGEVVGINTAIRAGANGIGFATPVDALKDILTQLREKGFVERGKLGILFQPLTPALAQALSIESARGALVSEVEPNGAAARAGIKGGDVIVAVNGVAIAHAEDLPRNVARNAPGSDIKVAIVRGGQRREIVAKLDMMPDDDPARPIAPKKNRAPAQSADKLGIEISDAPGGGVRVDRVENEIQDIEPGDVIIELNGTPVKTVQDLKLAASKVKGGTTALAKVRRGRLIKYAAIPLPKK
jgi:serine protease Do